MAIEIDYDKIYHTKHYGDFKVVESLGYINNDSRLWVKVRFLNTGTERKVRYDALSYVTDLHDPYAPIIHGVGYIGEDYGSRNVYKREYDRWINILSRCYNENDNSYHNYGAMGVRVDERWHNFSNFYRDIRELPGYRFKTQDPFGYALDKDYLQYGVPKDQKVYSRDTCVWIPRGINTSITYTDSSTELDYVDRQGNLKKMQMYHLVNE